MGLLHTAKDAAIHGSGVDAGRRETAYLSESQGCHTGLLHPVAVLVPVLRIRSSRSLWDT